MCGVDVVTCKPSCLPKQKTEEEKSEDEREVEIYVSRDGKYNFE